jgi:hypothetical protein
MTRRILSIVFPWYVLWRIKQLATGPGPSDDAYDEWYRGYFRAMWEVRLNLGVPDPPSDTSNQEHGS